ncbi:MAG: hypothetical protein ABIH74_02300, partial [Candidatus Omnitrophota bacterium]
TAIQHTGTIMILIHGGSLVLVIHWMAACYILRIIAYICLATRFFSFSAMIPGFSAEAVKRIAGFAASLMSITVFSVIHLNADRIIISKLLPIGMVGYFGVASANVNRARFLTNSVAQAAYPAFSEKFKQGSREEMMRQYRKLQDFICFALAPVMALVPFALLPLFSYMLNEQAAQMLLLPTTLLAAALYMNGALNVQHSLVIAVGRPGIPARLNFYALFVVLPATFLLIYYGNIYGGGYGGLVGAGVSRVFYVVFAYCYAVPMVCRECLKIPALQWFARVGRFYVLVAVTYGVAWAVHNAVGDYSIPSLAVAYLAGTIAFLAAGYFLICNELRETLLANIKLIKTKLANGVRQIASPDEPPSL